MEGVKILFDRKPCCNNPRYLAGLHPDISKITYDSKK